MTKKKKNQSQPKGKQKNSRVLFLTDTHFPYHHQDYYEFLKALKVKYAFDRVIHGGDEVDNHAMSFHDSDPDLPSAGDELEIAMVEMKKLYKLFPKVDVLESNHGSMIARKAKFHGIPMKYVKSYEDILEAPKGWKWHIDLTLTLSNGKKVYCTHGLGCKNVLKKSQAMGMSVIQGHFHEDSSVLYWANPMDLYFAMQVGSLVDDDTLAMAYNKANLKRPILSVGVIINGQPQIIPMILDKKGRWTGKLV